MMSPSLKGALFILAGSLFIGTMGTVQALAPEGAGPLSIGPLRVLGGGLVLALLPALRRALCLGRPHMRREAEPDAAWTPRLVGLLVLASAGLAGFQVFYFLACRLAGVAVGAMVSVGACPVVVGVLSAIFLRERPGKSWYVATLLALCGLALLTLAGGGEARFSVTGLAAGLAAAFSYSSYVVAIKRVLEGRGPLRVMTLVLLVGGAGLLPLMLTQPLAWTLSPRGVAVVLWLAVVTCALSLSLMLFGIKLCPASTAATLGLADPLFAALLGILFLREPANALTILGMAGLLAGTLVLIAAPYLRPPRPRNFAIRGQ